MLWHVIFASREELRVSSTEPLFVDAIEFGAHTQLSAQTGNYGLRIALVEGRRLLPVTEGMMPAIKVSSRSEQPVGLVILTGSEGNFFNVWTGERVINPNMCPTPEMWGLNPGGVGVFGAHMFHQERGMPWVVRRHQGTGTLCLTDRVRSTGIQVWRRTLASEGTGLAATMERSPMFTDATGLLEPIPHSKPGTASYRPDAELLLGLELVEREELPPDYYRQGESQGWGWHIQPTNR